MAKTKTPPKRKLTPMLRQYMEVKADYPDALVFYRMGDFYELFFEDAQLAAPLMEVTLTARHKGGPNEVPMCGVPHHALRNYLGKVIKAGYRAAICEQVEDPKASKGLVKREVTRVVTPGTLSDPDLLEGKETLLLAAIAGEVCQGAVAFLEVSTGNFFVRRYEDETEMRETLQGTWPGEVVASEAFSSSLGPWIDRLGLCLTPLQDSEVLDSTEAEDLLLRQLGASTLRGFGLESGEAAVNAAAQALAYAQSTQFSSLEHVTSLSVQVSGDALVLDSTTLANLEVLRNLKHGGRQNTLVSVLDRTQTSAGGRLLKHWLARPLRDPHSIAARHRAVVSLQSLPGALEIVRERLAGVGDLDRLLSRAVLGSMTPREAATLRDSLGQTPGIFAELASCEEVLLQEIRQADPLEDLFDFLDTMVVESPPAKLSDGGVIAAGVDEELDHYRSLSRDQKAHILAMESRQREETGINTLKIRYNKVFGYYLEVTKANSHLVPEHYIRKQTLVNAERYVTPEIKDLEEGILVAEERVQTLEAEHWRAVVQRVAREGLRLRALAEALARLDVLASFALVALQRRYEVPLMREAGMPLEIHEGRHPVVEKTSEEEFIPNDLYLDDEREQIILLTGPNMGGKSTYLRQVALIVLMAQAGSLVPAVSASLGVCDRIFTRVGASDDLARGESTFMVEMIETARILHQATSESLVVLDEVGRGTATFDGLSLAWAIVEHLHEHCRPKTLFATHYHELTELASTLARVKNCTLSVKEWKEEIIFLRRVVPGTADKSYGLQVARLAGLPREVIDRAGEVLANLEKQEYDVLGVPRLAKGERAPAVSAATTGQLNLFTPPEEIVAGLIQDLDIEALTPLAALNLLHTFKERLG